MSSLEAGNRKISRLLVDHFRCPEGTGRYILSGRLSAEAGYFRVGEDVLCFGQCATLDPARSLEGPLEDAAEALGIESRLPSLPFDPDQLVDNLRQEQYMNDAKDNPLTRSALGIAKRAYYGVRPLLPLKIRRPFQKAYIRGRQRRPFPRWPVDCTVETILERLLAANLKATGADGVPFIWFWPKGASACAIMTHDVETAAGRNFCTRLMDIDDEYGLKASFQIVPERRYKVEESFLEAIRKRGFEINIQDLNHDGQLYASRDEFLSRARRINTYGKKYGALGFRSAVLYRRPEWFDALEFSYDMSIPNSAHMDPQPGGCCSLFPYFIGGLLELPVTTFQDYSLFHILEEYSIELWKWQLKLILNAHGLASFIIHPDYIIGARPREVYAQLMAYLKSWARESNIWLALPGEVNRWWRDRSQMTLVQRDGVWEIEGPGKDQALIACATLGADGTIQYGIGASLVNEKCMASRAYGNADNRFMA